MPSCQSHQEAEKQSKRQVGANAMAEANQHAAKMPKGHGSETERALH